MAWEIGVIVDPSYDPLAATALGSDMPLWIIDTPSNRAFAEKLWAASKEIWLPQPICTTFRVTDVNTREQNCLHILDTVLEHHPQIGRLNFAGVNGTELLKSRLRELGFTVLTDGPDKVSFIRSVRSMQNVPNLQLDASNWKTHDDIYKSLFEILGAPEWHGKNFDALNDSIVTGSINAVEVPYTISVTGMKSANPDVQRFVSDLIDFISDREAEGCPISIQIENN